MISLAIFLVLVYCSTASGECTYRTEPFNCTELACPSERVTCSLKNQIDICYCAKGYLWTEIGNETNKICSYQQISVKEAQIWQGTFILADSPGVGLIHIGQKTKGIVMLCLSLCPFLLICFGICMVRSELLRIPGLVCIGIGSLAPLGAFIWWIVSMVRLKNGQLPDGNGCPLY